MNEHAPILTNKACQINAIGEGCGSLGLNGMTYMTFEGVWFYNCKNVFGPKQRMKPYFLCVFLFCQ